MEPLLTFHAATYAAGEQHSPHWHEELQLSLVLGGAVAEQVGTVRHHAGVLSCAVKDAGTVHADAFGPRGARLVRLDLPAGTLADLLDDPERSPGWRWQHDPAAARPFLRLVLRAEAGDRVFSAEDPDVVDLLAALTARPVASSGQPPGWLERTLEQMRTEWHSELTAAAVAKRAGVHPVYLARCVRRWYGTGVAEELRLLRLRSAAAALADDAGGVASAAQGFADEPHFCRTFRSATGITPGRFRQLLRQLPCGTAATARRGH